MRHRFLVIGKKTLKAVVAFDDLVGLNLYNHYILCRIIVVILNVYDKTKELKFEKKRCYTMVPSESTKSNASATTVAVSYPPREPLLED